MKELMQSAGILGAGGAGFPSYAKLAAGADTLVVNGAECEPLLYTDYHLLKRELSLVLEGIQKVMEYAQIARALLSVKQHTAEKLKWTDGQVLAERISVKVLPNVYPMGDEISLIYESTGRVVKPGNLPITAGVIVLNVETLYNAGNAVRFGKPVTETWLTIGGDIPQPITLKVPVGTPVETVFARYEITVPETHTVLDGGPSMGKVIDHETAVIGKTTKGLLILPNSSPAVQSKYLDAKKSVARAETACCQCTRCTDLCPRYLLGYPLEPHKMVRTAMGVAEVMPEMVITANLCCGCGICETLACCQGISPKAVITQYKEVIGKNKIRYVAKDEVEARTERDYRMIPSEKWESVLGVRFYDRVSVFKDEPIEVKKVEINLRPHIGAPSVPCVQNGDRVQKGDVIASAGEGLSIAQHASIDGTAYVDGNKITIYKD
jgi:Na+-translocating ferredoxin:NAD+ oxidoreductase RnfC subunit